MRIPLYFLAAFFGLVGLAVVGTCGTESTHAAERESYPYGRHCEDVDFRIAHILAFWPEHTFTFEGTYSITKDDNQVGNTGWYMAEALGAVMTDSLGIQRVFAISFITSVEQGTTLVTLDDEDGCPIGSSLFDTNSVHLIMDHAGRLEYQRGEGG